MCGFASAEEYT